MDLKGLKTMIEGLTEVFQCDILDGTLTIKEKDIVKPNLNKKENEEPFYVKRIVSNRECIVKNMSNIGAR